MPTRLSLLAFALLFLEATLALALPGCGGAAMSTADAPASSTRIAVVDVERVIKETDQGRRALEELQAAQEEAIARAKEVRDRLQKAAEEIKELRDAEEPDEEALAEKATEFEQLRMQAAQMAQREQQELRATEQRLLAPVTAEITDVVRKIGEQQGYALILDRRTTAYVEASADVTEQVIDRMAIGGDLGDDLGDGEDGLSSRVDDHEGDRGAGSVSAAGGLRSPVVVRLGAIDLRARE